MRDERALITGGAGTIGSNIVDQLVGPARREVVVLDNLVRGRRENLAGRWPTGRVRLVEGDIRDRELVAELTARHRRRLPPGRDPDHPVRRRSRAWPSRCWSTAPTTSIEAAAARGRAQGRRRVVRVGLRAGRGVPDRRAPPPVRQRHALRRGEDVQRGPAAQLPRHARPRLRRAALLQRVRPADGHPRPLHRGARPLDGADRGRRSRR